jgi:hypothetical protein
MYRVGATFGAKFLDRELVGLRLLVFGGGVVALLATLTRQTDQISHCGAPIIDSLRDAFPASQI